MAKVEFKTYKVTLRQKDNSLPDLTVEVTAKHAYVDVRGTLVFHDGVINYKDDTVASFAPNQWKHMQSIS